MAQGRASISNEECENVVGQSEDNSQRTDDVKPDNCARRDKGQRKAPFNLTRRQALIGAGGFVFMLALGGLGVSDAFATKTIIRPPGGQDTDALLSKCIRCEKCYEACPRKVIVPAHLEDGLVGMRTPTLDYSTAYCDYCTEDNGGFPLCVDACPNDALKLPDNATKYNVIIGLAVIDERTCLAYRETGCKTCYDNCPYEAIELYQPEGARYPLPVVVADKCNGCGACESVCISLSAGSIVEGATEVAIRVYPIED